MVLASDILAHLQRIEALLRHHQVWQTIAPDPHALQSDQPFGLDRLQPTEWLQWVLIPRCRELIDQEQPLPGPLTLTPYFDHALEQNALYPPLIKLLTEFDALFIQSEK